MRLGVLVLDDLFDTGLSTVLDALELGEVLRSRLHPRVAPLSVSTIGMRRRVRTHRGHTLIPQRRAGDAVELDCLIVPAVFAAEPAHVEQALARPDVRDAVAFLRDAAARRLSVASACTGTFVTAEAGLLDRHRATTAWWLAPTFRERYPAVLLDESAMVLRDRRRVTAGAALGHMDLALFLVGEVNRELGETLSRYMLSDVRPSQAPFVIPEHLSRSEPVLERFEHYVRRHLGRGFVMHDAARAAGTSQRSLERTVRRVLGRSPLSFVQDLRVEMAVQLLQTSERSVEEIAADVGYEDGTTLRTLLRRKLGRGVRELRLRGA